MYSSVILCMLLICAAVWCNKSSSLSCLGSIGRQQDYLWNIWNFFDLQETVVRFLEPPYIIARPRRVKRSRITAEREKFDWTSTLISHGRIGSARRQQWPITEHCALSIWRFPDGFDGAKTALSACVTHWTLALRKNVTLWWSELSSSSSFATDSVCHR